MEMFGKVLDMGKRAHLTNPGQLNLFDIIKKVSQEEKNLASKAGSFNIDARIRAMLSDALKKCPLSREVVAGKMSELLSVEITKSQLDSWTAESKENHRFPFAYSSAFCEATGNVDIFRTAVEMVGCYLLKGEDALLTELGRIGKQKEEIAKKERLIRQTLEQLGIRKEHY